MRAYLERCIAERVEKIDDYKLRCRFLEAELSAYQDALDHIEEPAAPTSPPEAPAPKLDAIPSKLDSQNAPLATTTAQESEPSEPVEKINKAVPRYPSQHARAEILAHLKKIAGKDGCASISLDALSTATKVSKSTVQHGLGLLVRDKVIKLVKSGTAFGPAVYRVLQPKAKSEEYPGLSGPAREAVSTHRPGSQPDRAQEPVTPGGTKSADRSAGEAVKAASQPIPAPLVPRPEPKPATETPRSWENKPFTERPKLTVTGNHIVIPGRKPPMIRIDRPAAVALQCLIDNWSSSVPTDKLITVIAIQTAAPKGEVTKDIKSIMDQLALALEPEGFAVVKRDGWALVETIKQGELA